MECNRFESRTGDVVLVDVAGQTHDHAAGIGLPVWGEEAGEGRHDVAAAVVLDLFRQRLNLGSIGNDSEVVTQPLHEGPRDGDGTFEGVDSLGVADLVGHRRQQTVLAGHRLVAGVDEHEVAGAVGVLGLALLEACLTEGRRLLVTEDAADRGVDDEAVLRTVPIDLGAGFDLREHRDGDAHLTGDLLVPVQGLNVHQHRPGRIRDVGDVDSAVDAAGEVPEHPGVHGAEEQVSGFSGLFDALDVVEDPLGLRPGEVGGQGQTDPVLVLVGTFVSGEFVADLLCSGVLPDDRVVDRLAGVLVPDHRGLTLIRDADAPRAGGG